jgi:hypothetical protein
MKRLISLLAGLAILASGCMTASIKAPSGEVAKARGFLMTVSGLKYTMNADGSAAFSFDNASGDVQMVNALGAFAQQAAAIAMTFAMTNPAPTHATNAPAPAK